MHYRFVMVVLMFAVIVLGACTPPRAGSLLETNTPAGLTLTPDAPTVIPTATTAPTLTPTLEPSATQTPTRTATPLPIVDFDMPAAYEPFADQWPLGQIEQTDGHILRCAIDTAELQYGEITLPGNLIMKSWAKCYFITADGRTDYVNIPIFVEDHLNKKMYLVFSTGPSRLPGTGYLIPALKKGIEEGWLPIAINTPELGVWVVGVSFVPNAAEQVTVGQQFFEKVYDGLDMSDFARFAESGDTGGLPSVGGMDHFIPIDALYFDVQN